MITLSILDPVYTIFDVISDGFQTLLNFFETLWALITSVFDGILTAISAVYLSAPVTYSLVALMPSVVSGFIILTVAFCCIKFLVGRDN